MSKNAHQSENFVMNDEKFKEVNYVSKEEAENGVHKLFRDNITVQKSDTTYLLFSILLGTLPLLCTGIEMVWLSPMLPYLQSFDKNINPLEKPITVIETSFLGGLPIIIGVIGCIIIPKLADIIGRKNGLLFIGIFMFGNYLGKAFSQSVICIIIFRSLFGLVFVGCTIINQVYISELCEDHNRAKYVCLKTSAFPLGNLISYSLGSYLGYKNFNIFVAILGLPFFLFYFAPETPVYYLNKGRVDDCKKSLKKLRSNKSSDELNADFIKIEETLKAAKVSKRNSGFLSLFRTKETRTAVGLSLFLCALEYLSGICIIASFLGPLLHEAGSVYSADSMTIIAAASQFVSLVSTFFFVEKFHRKTLLIVSCLGCSLSLFFFGLYYCLKLHNSFLMPYIQWAPIACVIVYLMMFGIGLGPLPLAIISELFPPDLAGTALSFGSVTSNVVVGFLLFIYPILADLIGVYHCIWILSGNCCIGGVLVYYFLPETKGKSNVEIQEMLKQY